MMTAILRALQRPALRFVLMLGLFVGCTLIAMGMYERMLRDQVQTVTEAANVAFTRLFVNEAWAELRPMLDLDAKVHPRDNPSLSDVDMRVRRFAKGTDLIKVKIYNMQGLTVYSSDPAQLGEDKASNKGFLSATRGRVISETNYRGKFGAFDGELYDRNLVSSYVPVRSVSGVEAVVEVYADRTSSIEGVQQTMRQAWLEFGALMAGVFVLVWLLLHMQSRRPDGYTPTEPKQPGQSQNTAAATDFDPAGLLHQAVIRLGEESRRLQHHWQALSANPSDALQRGEMPKALQSLLSAVEELILTQNPEDAWVESAKPAELGSQIEHMLEAARARYSAEGVSVEGHVAPAIAHQQTPRTAGVARFVRILLEDAVRRTGQGRVRLMVQPGHDGRMHIEVLGIRAEGSPTPEAAQAASSLSLTAAHALAEAMGGKLEQTSFTERGPWASASLPLNA